MATATTAHGRPPAAHSAPPQRRRRGHGPRRRATPYLFLLPALLLELLVHLIPMAVGVWMSTRGLTQFFIRNWSSAPSKGLGNYRVAVDLNTPVGRDLLHSLWVTALY